MIRSKKQSDDTFFSVVMPAHNEAGIIEETCRSIMDQFKAERIHDFEILVINDNSTDNTEEVLRGLKRRYANLRYLDNAPAHGFGLAVKKGLENFRGKAVCVVMADLSDAPLDIVTCYREMKKGCECVFGSRFIKGSRIIDYPKLKLIINRLANWFIKVLFRIDHNDITNAFKCYSREVIEGIQPVLSHHFNLTVELPLKAIVRGFQYKTIPISWTNRKYGVSKLKLEEMGSRYLFIVLYVFLERILSKRDYHRSKTPGS